MNNYKLNNIKIVDIEKLEGIKEAPVVNIDSSLSMWYNKVRNKKLKDLSDGDIARFIRQDIFLHYIVYEAITRLSKNPMIGELYDGEVLKMLSQIDKNFWLENIDLGKKIINIINELESQDNIPDDFVWMSVEEEVQFYQQAKNFRDKLETLYI